MSVNPIVLVVDDNPHAAADLEAVAGKSFVFRHAVTLESAEKILAGEWVRIVLAGAEVNGRSGPAFLEDVKDGWPDVVRLLISDEADAESVIGAANGAEIFDVVTRPWMREKAILSLSNAAEFYRLRRQNETLEIEARIAGSRSAPEPRCTPTPGDIEDGIIRAPNSPMNAICETLHQVASYDVSVLLTGESGTGKELAARALHARSLRWNKPFVVENCGALPDTLLESELFGHVKGAFTGAVSTHEGLFERADGGTIFLDEIGEISSTFQVKLLRVLQEGEIRPVGGRTTKSVDVRVIAATNRDLEEDVRAGRFREDLYYRLTTVTVAIPPLRDRVMDIPAISKALLRDTETLLGKGVRGIAAETLGYLCAYSWPGNVRELQNEIKQLVVMGQEDGWLGPELLSQRVREEAVFSDVPQIGEAGELNEAVSAFCELSGTLKDRIETIEVEILRACLERHNGNKSRAARELGLSRVGLRGKLRRYGLDTQAGSEQALAAE